MTTLSELQTQVRDYTETDNQVLTDTIINDFIEHSEYRIFKDVDLDCYKAVVSGNTQANNRWVDLPGYSTNAYDPTLQNYATIRYVTLYVDSGTKDRFKLVKVDSDFMNEYYTTPETGSAEKPKYYAHWDDGRFVIAPTPNAVYKFEIGITRLPASLTAAGASGKTWVSQNAPRVLLYSCLCEAFKFLKAPQDQQVYETSYKEALTALAQEQMGKKRRDEYRDGALRIAIPSQNP